MKIKHVTTSLMLACCSALLSGCTRNGLEGTAQFFGGNKPASGIQIEARTSTDIKEEQGKAFVSATTDSAGRFTLKGLLPHRPYQIRARIPNFESTTVYEDAPEKGTKIMERPLTVCPVPASAGVWLFDFTSGQTERIKFDKKVGIRAHEDIIEGGFGYQSAFSISTNDAQSVSVTLPRNGLLVILGGGISDLARLFHVPQKTVPGFQADKSLIQAGWYYNVRDFYDEPFMGAKLRRPRIQKPNLEGAYKSQNVSLWAMPLGALEPGLYILTTTVATGQRASQVLFGEDHPQEGYVFKID